MKRDRDRLTGKVSDHNIDESAAREDFLNKVSLIIAEEVKNINKDSSRLKHMIQKQMKEESGDAIKSEWLCQTALQENEIQNRTEHRFKAEGIDQRMETKKNYYNRNTQQTMFQYMAQEKKEKLAKKTHHEEFKKQLNMLTADNVDEISQKFNKTMKSLLPDNVEEMVKFLEWAYIKVIEKDYG